MTLTNYVAVGKHIEGGRLRIIGITSAKRSPCIPEVPTIAEGGLPGYAVEMWYGLFMPAKTPPAIVAFLNKELNAVVQSQPFRERMEALGMTVPADNTPEKLADLLRRETVRQAALAKLSGHAPLAPQR